MPEGMVAIERARPWHARRLTEIAFAAKRHWGYPEAWIRLWWDELVISPDYVAASVVFLARRGGRTVGWAGASAAPRAWSLDHLWVDPAEMRAGVGSALLARLREEVAARGPTRLVVESDPHAAAFYERHGAVRIGDAPSRPRPRAIPVYELPVPGSRA